MEAKDKMKGGLLLDVIIRQGATVLKLFSCEDKALLVRRNTGVVVGHWWLCLETNENVR
jgi:hypothetical protein